MWELTPTKMHLVILIMSRLFTATVQVCPVSSSKFPWEPLWPPARSDNLGEVSCPLGAMGGRNVYPLWGQGTNHCTLVVPSSWEVRACLNAANRAQRGQLRSGNSSGPVSSCGGSDYMANTLHLHGLLWVFTLIWDRQGKKTEVLTNIISAQSIN